jgi:hypothetical protein
VSNHENSSCGINPSKHVARVVVVIITEALGEVFRLKKFETSVIENAVAVPVFVAKAPFWTPNLDPNLDPILHPNLDPILDLLKTNRPDCSTQLFGFQYHDDRLNSFSFFRLSESSILFNVLIISVSGNRIIIGRNFILLQNVQFPTPRRHLEVKCPGGW